MDFSGLLTVVAGVPTTRCVLRPHGHPAGRQSVNKPRIISDELRDVSNMRELFSQSLPAWNCVDVTLSLSIIELFAFVLTDINAIDVTSFQASVCESLRGEVYTIVEVIKFQDSK